MNKPLSKAVSQEKAIAGALLLAAVTVAVYWPALHGGFVWDDDSMVTHNGLLRSLSGLRRIWFSTEPIDYWPVTWSALWIQWRLWGMHAAGYHAVNLLLHVAEALLLWRVLWRLRVPGAYAAAFLFAVHPVNVETVAWISELKNLLAMLFFLLSILAYIRHEEFLQEAGLSNHFNRKIGETGGHGALCGSTGTLGGSRSSRSGLQLMLPDLPVKSNGTTAASRSSCKKYYGASLLFFVLAMLSKGSVAIEPLVLIGIVLWRRRIGFRDLLRLAPFFAVAAALVAVDMWFQKHGVPYVIRDAGFLERLLGAGAAVWFYLGKALWPAHLSFVYPQWRISAADLRCWAPLAAIIGLTLVLWRSRGGACRASLYAWGYFCVALLPVMGFADVYFMRYSLVADHYQHLALIGVLALAGCFLWRIPSVAPRAALAAAAVLILGALTWRQCGHYRDARTLYQATLRENPDAWIAHNNLALILADEGRLGDAEAHFKAALTLKPDLMEADNDLGVTLAAEGRLREAEVFLRRALALKPASYEAHYNLGLVLAAAGRYPEAAAEYETVERLKPGFRLTEANLRAALNAQRQGRP